MAKSVMAELGGQPDGNSCSMTLNQAAAQAGNAGTESNNGTKRGWSQAGRKNTGRFFSWVPFVCVESFYYCAENFVQTCVRGHGLPANLNETPV